MRWQSSAENFESTKATKPSVDLKVGTPASLQGIPVQAPNIMLL